MRNKNQKTKKLRSQKAQQGAITRLRKGNNIIEIHAEQAQGGYNWLYVFIEHHQYKHISMVEFYKRINRLGHRGWEIID